MHVLKAATAIGAACLLIATDAGAQTTVQLATASDNREVWRGETTGSKAGLSLDRGDVSSGDSRHDLIAGAPEWSASRGRVYVVFAGPVRRGEVSFSNANAILSGAANGDRFGAATAAGFVTARELASPMPRRDLIVGAPGANSGAGAVYLFMRGLAFGANLTPADARLTISGAPAGAQLGAALATGDLDGDGYREIIAGAPGVGTVYVIKGGPSLSGTINLAVPSGAFFAIQGSAAAGVGKSLAAGDLTGHGAGTTNVIYDLAIGAQDEAGGGAVYVVKGRTSNTFPGVMNLTTEADLRFGGIDSGDQAGFSIEIRPFDRDSFYDLIVGAPGGDGPGNSRANAGEVYVMWGSASLGSGSFASAHLTIYGAAAGHQEGTDIAYGKVSRGGSEDIGFLAPGASTGGELHVVLGRPRSNFGSVYDFASTVPDRRFVGDPAAGKLRQIVIYDLTGEGFDDVVGGAPDVTEGRVYVSFSPSFTDSGEPNDTYTTATSLTAGVPYQSHIFTSNDVDWFRFDLREDAHVRIGLDVPAGLNLAMDLHSTTSLLKVSNNPGAGDDETILTTLSPGTYYVRVIGFGAFSQETPYSLHTVASFFSDAFEPNNGTGTAVTIGSLPYEAKIYTEQDLDWYRFRMSSSGTVNVALNVPAATDLQLVLYTATGGFIAASQNGAGVNELITRSLSGPADYLVRVSSGGSWSTTQNYRLAISGAGLANPLISNVLLGQGPQSAMGGYFAVHGGAESGYGHSSWRRLPWPTYNASGGGVRLATGDVDGDGLDEVVLGLGPGSNGYVAVLDDAAHGYALLTWLRVDWPTYTAGNGEVFPAVGDIDSDGRAEIVLGLGNGGQGWFQVFDDAVQRFRHLTWKRVSWPAYNAGPGSTRPAVGDVDGDGVAEIILGLGNGSAGWIEVKKGASFGYAHSAWLQVRWPAYNAASGATFPAAGDLDSDGRAEIVVGLGNGSQGWFQVMDDASAGYAHLRWEQLRWPSYNSANGETHPAVGNIDGDPAAEIILGLGQFTGNGGWFEVRDDAASGYAQRGWRQVPWPAFVSSGGALFPAILSRR